MILSSKNITKQFDNPKVVDQLLPHPFTFFSCFTISRVDHHLRAPEL